MISVIDIKSIVQSGEGYNAEFKRSVPPKVKEISEEVCAFANATGGIILIGVTDENQIIGAQIDKKNVLLFRIELARLLQVFIV